MPTVDETIIDLLQLLGAGAIGGLIGPYLTHAKERREARAAVRKHLADVENARWAAQGLDFMAAASAFEAAALAARLPRPIVDLYANLATVGREHSEHDAREAEEHGYEDAGAIDGELYDHIRSARDLVIDAIWQPWRTARIANRRVAELRERVEQTYNRHVAEQYPVAWLTWKK